MSAVAPQDRLDIVFINREMPIHESGKTGMMFIAVQDGSRIMKEGLGIRDDAGKQEGMGGAAFPASDPAYTQTQEAVTSFDSAQVGTIPDQAGGAAAGTSQLVELEGVYYFIIKILRKSVVKFVFNRYHDTIRVAKATGGLGRNEALVGGVPACFYVTKRYNNTITPDGKQSDGKYIKFLCAGAFLACWKN